MFILIFFIANSVNATDVLPDNGGKITSSQIIQTKTGTGPFDDNDDPGNDSSEDNDVVRSFDQVTWTIENTMAINNSTAQSYCGGKIYFEATLPNVFNSETAKWDTDSMTWIENLSISSDKLTIKGYYSMTEDNITIPGKQTLIFVAKILGAKNGTEFQPTIKLWLNGNKEENVKTIILEKLKVSAAPKYNIVLKRSTEWDERVTVNYDSADHTGRMYGYYVILQLYNTDASKGMRGIEYPQGEITFDVDYKFTTSPFGSKEVTDITKDAQIKLWNYKISSSSKNGVISDRSMVFTTYLAWGSGNWIAPSGKRGSVLNAVY